MGHLIVMFKMNKLFLVCLVFSLAMGIHGQPKDSKPLFENECSANEFMLDTMKRLKDGAPDTRDCPEFSMCFTYLAATITTCIYSVVNWAAVPYCVQDAIGTGDICFSCVCEVVEWTCGCDLDYPC